MTDTTPTPDGPDQEEAGHATGYGDGEGRSGIDTPTNEDLHGAAAEVAESSKGPGPAETPAG